jgi:hypothetical protein
MTQDAVTAQFLRVMGQFVPPSDPDAVCAEWVRAFALTDADDFEQAVSKMLAERVDRFCPTIGEIRGFVASVQAGRERYTRCASCAGSGWVDATPWTANGGRVYEGVRRCSDCGIPVPMTGDLRQTPLTASAYVSWMDGLRTPETIQTQAEFLARVRQVAGGKVAALLTRRDPGQEG